MTSEKRQSKNNEIIELKKELAEIDRQIDECKKNSPTLNSIDNKELQDRYKFKYQEYMTKMEEFDSLYSKMEKAKKSDMEYYYNLVSLRKQEIESIQKELDELKKQLDIKSSEEGRKYLALEVKKNKILDRLLELLEKKPELKHSSKMEAEEKKASPFGPVIVKKNLLENIINSQDWQNNFSTKNNLQIFKSEHEEKIKFVSVEKNIHLEVNNESVKGRWEKIHEQDAINLMVELYLKAIENKKIDQHRAQASDPETTQFMEAELAKKLRELGQQNVLINDKKLEDIQGSQMGFQSVNQRSTH